ncbi:MAG: disulfide bond formation protein B [Hyphomicrobiaceae bacterium]
MRAPATASSAYKWGATALFIATAVILLALGFEYIGGYKPCPLCLQQRWAYYASIPLLFLCLVLLGAERPGLAALLFLLVALFFLANAGLGVYHAGAEWKFWPGPDTCAPVGAPSFSSRGTGGVLGKLNTSHVIRCDEAQFRWLGLSFAGWNVVACLILFTASLKAAFASNDRKTGL